MFKSPTSRSEIVRTVDALKDDLFAFSQQLVQVPSLPGQEASVQAIVEAKLKTLGLDVTTVSSTRGELETHPAFCDDGIPVEQRINIVGRWPAGGHASSDARRSLILNGHVDVVSPGNESLWNTSPWSGHIQDGRLYGRGSCDMKAGLSAAIFAIEALQRARVRLQADVLLESVSGEESGGVGTLSTIVNGYRADAAIIVEPTELEICVTQSGALTFRLCVEGRSAHACVKQLGVSAIDKAYQVLEAIADLERRRHVAYHNPLYPDPMHVAPISIGTIRGGDWHSMVAGEVVLEGRYGVLPGESIDQARRALSETVQQACARDPWLRDHPPVLEWFEGQFESGATDQDSPIVRVLGETHRAVIGREPALKGVTYGSDLRLFTNHAGMPAVLYGPGSVLQAHAVNEFVELDEVLDSARILALTIHEWCGETEAHADHVERRSNGVVARP